MKKKVPRPEINSLDDALAWLKSSTVGCGELIEFLENAKREGLELLPKQATLDMEEVADHYAQNTLRGQFTWGDAWERMVSTYLYFRGHHENVTETHAVSSR